MIIIHSVYDFKNDFYYYTIKHLPFYNGHDKKIANTEFIDFS